MTAMADITIKKSDGTTDITWSAVTASAGDKTPALWRSTSPSGTTGQKPWFSMSGRSNAAGDVRRVDLSGAFPSVYTDSNTGLTQVLSKIPMSLTIAMPQNVSQSDIDEAVYQFFNLVSSSLIKGSTRYGYAPV